MNKTTVIEALENKWNRAGDTNMTLSLFMNGISSSDSAKNTLKQVGIDSPSNIASLQYWTLDFANDLAAILYPNICRTWSDSYQAFGYVDTSPNSFSNLDRFLIRNVGSLAMTFAASKIKSMFLFY